MAEEVLQALRNALQDEKDTQRAIIYRLDQVWNSLRATSTSNMSHVFISAGQKVCFAYLCALRSKAITAATGSLSVSVLEDIATKVSETPISDNIRQCISCYFSCNTSRGKKRTGR